jgi:hypothetical protein
MFAGKPNIELSKKGLRGKNNLAYLAHLLITTVISFVTFGPWLKIFSQV